MRRTPRWWHPPGGEFGAGRLDGAWTRPRRPRHAGRLAARAAASSAAGGGTATTPARADRARWSSARRACSTPATRDGARRAGRRARVRARAARAAAARPGGRRDDGLRARRRSGSSAAAGSSRPTSRFASEAELRHAIERILAPLGRRADEAEPLCDARLPDGSRVNVVLPPLALDGPLLTIRRFRPRGFAPGRPRRARARCAAPLLDFLGARRARALHAADLRRHRLGQDDDARRARRVRRPGASGS